jgi:hypothetical protein
MGAVCARQCNPSEHHYAHRGLVVSGSSNQSHRMHAACLPADSHQPHHYIQAGVRQFQNLCAGENSQLHPLLAISHDLPDALQNLDNVVTEGRKVGGEGKAAVEDAVKRQSVTLDRWREVNLCLCSAVVPFAWHHIQFRRCVCGTWLPLLS